VGEHLKDLGDPLARAVLWSALWDMTRDAQLPAHDFTLLAINLDEMADGPTAFLEELVTALLQRRASSTINQTRWRVLCAPEWLSRRTP